MDKLGRPALIALSLLCAVCIAGIAMIARDIARDAGASPAVTILAMVGAAGIMVAALVVLAIRGRGER